MSGSIHEVWLQGYTEKVAWLNDIIMLVDSNKTNSKYKQKTVNDGSYTYFATLCGCEGGFCQKLVLFGPSYCGKVEEPLLGHQTSCVYCLSTGIYQLPTVPPSGLLWNYPAHLFNLAFLLWLVAVLCVSVPMGSSAILNAPLTSFPRQALSCQIIYLTLYFRQEQDALLTASLRSVCTDFRTGSQRTTFELLRPFWCACTHLSVPRVHIWILHLGWH